MQPARFAAGVPPRLRIAALAGCLAALLAGAALGQDFAAAQWFGPATATDVAALPDGGLALAGYYPGGGDFDPGPGTVTLTGSGRDAWVSRLDAAGALVWARALDASGDEAVISAVASDADGALYLTGTIDRFADFDPGPGSLVLGSSGRTDQVFVWKLSAAGELVWARLVDSSWGGAGRGIAVDAAGKVWVTGSFQHTADFDPGPAAFILESAGMQDVFVLALDAGGGFLHALRIGGGGTDDPYGGLALDAAGRPVVAGAFTGTVDFDPGPGSMALSAAADPFVLALNGDATVRWARHLASGSFWDIAYDVAATDDDGVIVVGSFRDTLDLDPGPAAVNLISPQTTSGFVVKLDANGNYSWGGGLTPYATNGGGGRSSLVGVAVGPKGDVYLTGTFRNVTDFDLGPGAFSLCSRNYGDDPFLLALGPTGAFRWVARFGGPDGFESAGAVAVPTAAAPADGAATEIVTVGGFNAAGDYDPGIPTFTLTPAGGDNTFVSRLTDAFAVPVLRRVPADFPTVQGAIDGSRHRDTILVAPGTYVENVDFHGQHVVLRSEAGPAATILDGGGVGPVVTFQDSEDEATLLEGFTIRNGWAGSVAVGLEGGGIRIQGDASPTIRGNLITGNEAGARGAGIVVRASRATIERNEIRGNGQIAGWGGGGGGGIGIIAAAALIQDNVIADNHWNQYGSGGGLHVQSTNGSTYIERNRIFDNQAPEGGGVTIMGGAVLAHNLVYGNQSNFGGGIYATAGGANSVYLLNNTVADNLSPQGSAVFLVSVGPAVLANNVLSSRAGEGPTVECGSPSAQHAFFSNVVYASGSGLEFGCSKPGGTNLVADPLFRDPAGRDYRLDPSSPAVDHGDNGWVLASVFGPEWDLDRRPRRVDEPGTPDTGIGEPPLVDAGAHESNPVFFYEGFEAGDLEAWSHHSPG